MSPSILTLKSLGVNNVEAFEFFERPDHDNMVKSLEQLYSLKIIDDFCNLTENVGKRMHAFPLNPRLTLALLEACKKLFL